ncbi:hypothetical protein GPECTOR_7g1020 [Gonium pectorale]|uniref:C-type lectin domain-containing protein n=1 Tax=Gonium pectorale TaxID=33097 RepID=A0A150GTH3_GONPE|nr:hypothetical protein GPECTOR_7g1020 [Gonium pectorale]|eukprot:KXZ53129.1 hypothetical protein GPECTOR_7g1020 [Gonium pectorale]
MAEPVLSFSRGSVRLNAFLAPKTNFNNAKARCGRGGGNLAAFSAQAEYTALLPLLSSSTLYRDGTERVVLWIGVDPRSPAGANETGLWLDDSPIEFWPKDNEPRQAGMCYALNCTSADGGGCSWDALPCGSTAPQGFLCETNTASVSYLYGVPSTGKTYVYGAAGAALRGATLLCSRWNGQLVSFNSDKEFDVVMTPLLNGSVPVKGNTISGGQLRTWLGIADRNATKWRDGTSVGPGSFSVTGAPGCYVARCPAPATGAAGAGSATAPSPDQCVWELADKCLTRNNFICEMPGVLEGPSGRVV